jgi:hypothetical protein
MSLRIALYSCNNIKFGFKTSGQRLFSSLDALLVGILPPAPTPGRPNSGGYHMLVIPLLFFFRCYVFVF